MNTLPQVTVFGATGRVGRQVVDLLLADGHAVVAAVHGEADMPTHTNLTTRRVDVYDQASVARAVKGSDTVVSALGSWGTKNQNVLSAGVTNIIAAMESQSIRRIVSLTGAEARAQGDSLGIIHRLMHIALLVIAPKILRDGEAHIAALEASHLDWTVVRSPIMSAAQGAREGKLSLARPLPWQRIARSAVAAQMVELVQGDTWVGQAPFIR